MQTSSPTIDRIGAALRALRRAYRPESDNDDSLPLGAMCLGAVVAQLAEDGMPQEDLQPLVELEAQLQQLMAQAQGQGVANRRRQLPPSELLLARGAAVIDLLIKGGADESEAAQMVMRRLMAVGVPPPKQGGDARGWKRLLEWRTALGHRLVSNEAQREYQEFNREIETIPAEQRVARVLDERLWDRRRKQP
jgi:hypothetical protein